MILGSFFLFPRAQIENDDVNVHRPYSCLRNDIYVMLLYMCLPGIFCINCATLQQ